jgi:hypothetical protein
MTDSRYPLSSLRTNRRQFVQQLGALGAASVMQPSSGFADFMAKPNSDAPTIVQNRTPLAPSVFCPFPLGSIRPAGWLKAQLQIQADGLGGHLDETWADVGASSGWLGGTGESWERGPYFVDGLVPLAYLLDDARLKNKAQKYIDWTLNNQASNGMIGPRSNDDWWPRMVMLKALTQYQEATGDPRVIPLMSRYFAYQMNELPKRNLRDWGKFRWQDEALSVIWLYNRTGDNKLVELLKILRAQGYDWVGLFQNFPYKDRITPAEIHLLDGGGLKDLSLSTHGVNHGQGIKTGPVQYLITGSDPDRRAVIRQIAELDKYHGLPNGMFSCDEHLAGRNPSQGSELCTVVEYMFSLEQSLGILGDAALGDRLERLAFNALPATLTDDMWAHQYDQQPNQVECSLHREPWTTNGIESNLFGLDPNFGCCAANFHQGWPKFAASLFMASPDGGVVAAAYAPCELRTNVSNTALHLIEETNYPFRETVQLTIKPASPVEFPLLLRIPSWASGASIRVNGELQPSPTASTFARITRLWKAGDRVNLEFPMQPRVSRWFQDSVAIERGPLVFSHGIGEAWVKLRDRGLTADWQVYPTTQWNYALAISPSPHDIGVVEKEIGTVPFSGKNPPVELQVKARKLPAWHAEEGVATPVPQSPVTSDQPEETISLIPYAAAKLRITAFPTLERERGIHNEETGGS